MRTHTHTHTHTKENNGILIHYAPLNPIGCHNPWRIPATLHEPNSMQTKRQRQAHGILRLPSSPRLPKEEQEIFEQLQKRSTGAFSTPQVNQSPQAAIQADGSGGELHPDAPKGLQPEFEGEKNPKTGEVGGPKNEPLRWGAGGDWSYGGRVTDF
ncbi:uncharacterized protein N7515_007691 [Penicillium bovifimosum]|uniref:Succinate dehydrogenase assembly factor 4, mitochondrial n=1 Tax=Penicillium bovifimosum TaxID=126998 RepID=A0A9W9KX10_9EURO|nr:uncharacterized protein N7515_007691 [Penicillium bovifimosum]KAJ5123866.1 hypothetical protein N7515_007691 [Penicillium bovifimosum]